MNVTHRFTGYSFTQESIIIILHTKLNQIQTESNINDNMCWDNRLVSTCVVILEK